MPEHIALVKGDLSKPGPVLVRAGHTEAAVDIARMAGLNPSGVICEIKNDDGTGAARRSDRLCATPRAQDRNHCRPDRASPAEGKDRRTPNGIDPQFPLR